jgi:hypothetical protein
MLQRVVHICTTGFSAVNVYICIDFSELYCLVHYMFYAYISFLGDAGNCAAS